jgi:Icc-related predicted phosphoesterase
MRILLVSDLHYSLRQLDWVVGSSVDFDLVVVAGDSLDVSSDVPLDVQTEVMLSYAQRLHATGATVISSGNHDLTGEDSNGERAALWMAQVGSSGASTDGDALQVGDVLVTVCPWWDGPEGRAGVEAQFVTDVRNRPEWWLWTYHWPPAGSPTCWTGSRDYGDPDVLGWIQAYQPDVVLAGHVHQSPFTQGGSWADRVGRTWVLNAGRQMGPEPAHIIVDLTERRATWLSQAGTEAVDLDSDSLPARTAI